VRTAPTLSPSEATKAVVRRNAEEVQSNGRFDVFDEWFSDDFVDHTPQPDSGADKHGVRGLYKMLRVAFPDFRAEIHWQRADGDTVTTFKTYYGTHKGAVSRLRGHWQGDSFRVGRRNARAKW
jgi:hypothetical protein